MATIKSIEEKAKAYDEAIEALRSLIAEQAIKHCDRVNIKDITNIFSELKESEDERIRKNIIATIHLYYGEPLDDEAKEMIAWLEKQGKNEKINEISYRIGIKRVLDNPESYGLEKQGEQKPSDLPKGEDYGIDSLYHAARILEKTLGEVDGYQSDDGILEHKCAIEAVNRLYKQKPAEYNKEIPTNLKDTVDKEANAIWKEESTDGCHLVIDSFNMFYGICMQIAEAVVDYKKPAEWSEEDENVLNNLIWALKEDMVLAGDRDTYTSWLEGLKNKVQPQPKQEWSEEDEEILQQVIADIEDLIAAESGVKFLADYHRHLNWLKSLKNKVVPQQKMEWSKDDEKLLNTIIAHFSEGHVSTTQNRRILNWLKSLKPQNSWKPSEEQLISLARASNRCVSVEDGKILVKLLEQLEKLTE